MMGRTAARKSRLLKSCCPPPFTSVDRCSKGNPKTAISAIFGDLRRDSDMSGLAQERVAASRDRTYPCSAVSFKNRVRIGASNLPHRFPRIVHYLSFASEWHPTRDH